MNVKGFKLISGEEIVARVESFDDKQNKYLIEKPKLIIPQQIGNQLTLGMVPWAIGSDENGTIFLKESAIIAEFNIVPEIEKEYIKQTTGIQLATGK